VHGSPRASGTVTKTVSHSPHSRSDTDSAWGSHRSSKFTCKQSIIQTPYKQSIISSHTEQKIDRARSKGWCHSTAEAWRWRRRANDWYLPHSPSNCRSCSSFDCWVTSGDESNTSPHPFQPFGGEVPLHFPTAVRVVVTKKPQTNSPGIPLRGLLNSPTTATPTAAATVS